MFGLEAFKQVFGKFLPCSVGDVARLGIFGRPGIRAAISALLAMPLRWFRLF